MALVQAADYECLIFDNRGMGASQPVGAALTVEQMAGDAFRLMDCAGPHGALLGQKAPRDDAGARQISSSGPEARLVKRRSSCRTAFGAPA